MRMIRLAALLVIVMGTIPDGSVSAGRPLRYKRCAIQEVHAPFPAEVVRNSLPAGFEPVAYGSLDIDEVVDVPTTTFDCRWKDGRLLEEWSWALVDPPASFESPKVDVYGFFIHGFSSRPQAPGSRQRSCASSSFEVPDRIDMSFRDAGGIGEGVFQATKDGYTDEVHSFGTNPGGPPMNVIRMFGYDGSGEVGSFDVILSAEEATLGHGYYVQRSGTPTVEGSTFAVPGYFAGHAWQIYASDLFIVPSGPIACA